MVPSASTRDSIERLLAALDSGALGDIYCHEGGDAFWSDRRPAVVEIGLLWAVELAARVSRGGRSLYVGAGVAELPALLTEVLDLERTCVAANLREAECDTLNASLAAVGLDQRLRLLACDALDVSDRGPFDHVALVNVLDDPETFPWVSGVTYGRASPLDLEPAAFEAERMRIRALMAALLSTLRLPAVVTTTAEEAPWVLEAAARAGIAVNGDDAAIDSPLVGDAIGFLRLTAPSAAAAR